jgi:hypothetical protein
MSFAGRCASDTALPFVRQLHRSSLDCRGGDDVVALRVHFQEVESAIAVLTNLTYPSTPLFPGVSKLRKGAACLLLNLPLET